MINIEEYLKERNIPTDSLEANSIRKGAQWMKDEISKRLDIIIKDTIQYNSHNYVEIITYLANSLAKIQDMYEHDNW